MFCYRDYKLTTRFNQKNKKSTSSHIFVVWLPFVFGFAIIADLKLWNLKTSYLTTSVSCWHLCLISVSACFMSCVALLSICICCHLPAHIFTNSLKVINSPTACTAPLICQTSVHSWTVPWYFRFLSGLRTYLFVPFHAYLFSLLCWNLCFPWLYPILLYGLCVP